MLLYEQAVMDMKNVFENHKWVIAENNQSPGSREATANMEKWWFRYLESRNIAPEWTSKGPSIELYPVYENFIGEQNWQFR